MAQSKITGKFYPLQQAEWVRACKELTPAELKVLYYIRTADPYSNGIRLTAAAIARNLDCERQTVSRAIKRLDSLQYIEMEPLEFNVKICGLGILGPDGVTTHQGCDDTPPAIATHHGCADTPPAIATHQTQQVEPPPCSPLDDSPPLKTNKDLNHTLSDAPKISEREKNLNFWNELPEPERSRIIDFATKFMIPRLEVQPSLPLKWIACNSIEIHYFARNPVEGESSGNSPLKEKYEVREWETSPGVAYPALEEERVQYWIAKGEPIESATAKSRAELRNPVTGKDLWDGFLRKCDRLADEAIRAQKLGANGYLPPSFSPLSEVTKESVAAKLDAAFQFSLNPKSEIEESIPSLEQLQVAMRSPLGATFAANQIESNPEWGYEIVDGVVALKTNAATRD